MKLSSLLCSKGVLLLLLVLLSVSWSDRNNDTSFSTQALSIENDTSSKGVYICITGQLARLELNNKIERLLLPLHSLGFDLYIALALNNGTHHFSNNNNGDKMRLVSDLDHAMSVLRGVEGVKEVMHFLPQHPENMYINKKYLKQLDNIPSASRVQNHARQFHSLQYCNQWPLIKNLTQVSIRVREDILFEVVDFAAILPIVKKRKIVTSACETWRGMNDKAAFLPSSFADTFFQYPYERYLTYNADKRGFNTEQFYWMIYGEKKLPIQQTLSLFVSKATTKRVSNNDDAIVMCEVTACPHYICGQRGCNYSLFLNALRSPHCKHAKFKKDPGVDYKAKCW